MSLAGLSAAPDVSAAHPVGVGGECLHDWLFRGAMGAGTTADRQAAAQVFAATGASIQYLRRKITN